MLELNENILGIDRRGRNIYYKDFQRNFAVLHNCKKLTPEGKRLQKIARYYKNNERKISEDYKKIQGAY
jgi:hypothetical protein